MGPESHTPQGQRRGPRNLRLSVFTISGPVPFDKQRTQSETLASGSLHPGPLKIETLSNFQR